MLQRSNHLQADYRFQLLVRPAERPLFSEKVSDMARNKTNAVLNTAKRFMHDESGATAVEYGIMLVAIAALIVVVVISIGGKTTGNFQTVETVLP